MRKPLKFRVYVNDASTLFVRVLIHFSKRSFLQRQRHLHQIGVQAEEDYSFDNALGTCSAVRRWYFYSSGRIRRDPCIAEVNLNTDNLEAETLSHEMLHAALEWARRINLDFDAIEDPEQTTSAVEEDLCYVFGRFVQAVVDRCVYEGLMPSDDD